MSLFNENFYTDDFNQEMIDYVDTLGNFTSRAYIGRFKGQRFLTYNVEDDYFWTNNITITLEQYNYLTKQQFKEKVGMTQKQFTKADLKNGMVVKYRGGNSYADKNNGLRLVLCKQFVGGDGFARFDEYLEDLSLEDDESTFDIVEVFKVIDPSDGLDYITNWTLKSIWKRPEPVEAPPVPSAEQIEIASIQAEMDKLSQRLSELKGKV